MRQDSAWEKIESGITSFAEEHNIPLPTRQRIRKRKRFMDELAIDGCIEDPIKKVKVDIYFHVLDSLYTQLTDRFPESSLAMVTQMGYFSHDGILKMVDDKKKGLKFNPSSIENLSEYYNLDKELIVDELDIFIDVYKATYLDIDISDVMSEKKNSERTSTANPEDSLSSDHDGDEEQENVTVTDKFKKKKNVDDWMKRGFIRPYRCLLNLSGFPHLSILYRILLSLPVTSCSAERTMSRLKIVKNRLRSTMGDSLLSSLLILSCEKDILKQISNEEIINKFALSSVKRKKLLLSKI
ncbi:uncharacterized protein LOC120353853 [Nilaparvata lugens]|uniref:uncharacterized protein LOC120353853 n=1 Tax=Nilaparvata lugens TaxID=108931 RepID=UPI00193E7E72|nr:uncharacterized protein LOC120353853 [Nilaparvata lugens]